MTQSRPRETLGLEVAQEFLRSSRRLIFEEDLMKALGSARSAIPVSLVYSRISTLTKFGVGNDQVCDQQAGEP